MNSAPVRSFCWALAISVALAGQSAAQTKEVRVQPGARRSSQPAARTAQVPAGQRPAAKPAPQPPPPPGYHLTPQQQAELDALLDAWELAGKAIDSFEVHFERFEYNDPAPNAPAGTQPQPPIQSSGTIKFKAPDKGLYLAQDKAGAVSDQWITDGKTIFEFRAQDKLVVKHHLPKELQGKGIVDGPLPFLFGTEAKKLKARYWLRIVPPGEKSPPDEIMLEARPRFREDAQNYVRAQVILRKKDLAMSALQVFYPGGRLRKVHSFGDPTVNERGPLAIFEKDFSKPKIPGGWKVLEDPAPGAPAAAPPPGTAVRPRSGRATK